MNEPEAGDLVGADETLDNLRVGGLRIIQSRRRYRFSLDPILLSAFSRIKEGDTVADLGTGGGIIPLLTARKCPQGQVVGLEIQPDLADRARRNVRLNKLEDRVIIMEGDVRLPPMELARGFDVVLANPPYRRAGAGRQALVEERARARHEVAGGLNDFLRAAAHMLRDGGRFYVVFLAERLTELLTGMRTHRLEPKRLRSIHSRAGDDACLVLVEGRKGAGSDGLSIMPPLIIYAEAEYTAEIVSIFGGERES